MTHGLLVGALIGLTLSACATTTDTAPPPDLTSDPASTQAQSEDALSGGESAGSESPPKTSPPVGEQPVSDCGEPEGLLVVTGVGGEVTVIHPDGTVVRELRGAVRAGHPGLQPTWAPVCEGGSHLITWTEVAEERSFLIALGDAITGEVRRSPAPLAPFYYYWSPDAQVVAYLGQNAFSPLQMGVLDLATEETELVDEGQPFYFDWRPDSGALIAHVGDSLSLITRADGAWSPGRLSLQPGLFQAPAWVGLDRFLSVVPAAAEPVEVGLNGPAAQGDLPRQHLVTSDQGGGRIETLADLEGPTVFAPQPGGTKVALRDFDGPLQVLDEGGDSAVALSERTVAAFQWSPDGSRLLFLEVDSEARALVPRVWDGSNTLIYPSFVPTRVFVTQYLPFWDQYSRSLTLWSPQSDAFTYPAASDDGERIMVQHLDDQVPTEVAEGVFASWSPRSP